MISLTPWLQHLEQKIALARADAHSEDVHQVRIAAGRLSVWLELAGLRVLRDDLRQLRQHADRVRDLDVALEQEPAQPLAHWMRAQRADRSGALIDAWSGRRPSALFAALSWMPAIDEQAARRKLAKLERQVLGAGEEITDGAEDFEAFHRLRRKSRRLRYAIEWLGLESAELKNLQEALGDLNNQIVLLRLSDSCPDREQCAEERGRIASSIGALRLTAIDAWRSAREKIGGL